VTFYTNHSLSFLLLYIKIRKISQTTNYYADNTDNILLAVTDFTSKSKL